MGKVGRKGKREKGKEEEKFAPQNQTELQEWGVRVGKTGRKSVFAVWTLSEPQNYSFGEDESRDKQLPAA